MDRDRSALDVARAAVEDALLSHAFRDDVTALPNRRALLQRLDHVAVRHPQRRLAIAVVDLVGLEAVNERHGFDAGDELLIAVAAVAKEAASTAGTVYRTGGSQLSVLVEGPGGLAETRKVVQMLLSRLSSVETSRGVAEVGVASGVACGPAMDNGDNFRKATAAATSASVGEVRAYDASADAAVQRRRRLELDVREAALRNELQVAFQPEIRLATGEVAMVEALVRWTHPMEGPISPAEFVPLAERTGAMTALGDWVLTEACLGSKELCDDRGPERIAVNVSATQLRDRSFSQRLRSILTDTRAEPSRLCFEITETVLLDDDADLTALHEMRDAGAVVAVDDFGTGFSSLSYLKRLPIDVLKIDRSFVSGLGEDDDDSTIVRAIIRLARGLSLGVVAEGVETPGQTAVLRRLGCDIAQGYAFARPMGAEALVEWMDARASVIDLRSPSNAR